jgi:hypothetical protein
MSGAEDTGEPPDIHTLEQKYQDLQHERDK